MSAYDPDTLAVGVLGKPHGLSGEILLRPLNQAGSLAWLEQHHPDTLILERDGVRSQRRLRSCRAAGGQLRVAFEGITTPEEVRALTLSVVRVPRDLLPPLGPGEFYVDDVPGCTVVTPEGTVLGTVAETFWNGAHDVMLVGEHMIPMVPDFVRTVDAKGRKIVVTWDGLDD